MEKWVYTFADGNAEGDATMADLLGGKGANLAEMCTLGLPVPPGLTITTDASNWYYSNRKSFPDSLQNQVIEAIERISKLTGRSFGNGDSPLLLAIRSGSRVSMPGMMDTVLNLGLNDQTVQALAKEADSERFALDSYRRFIQMYSDIVLGIDHAFFEEVLDDAKARFELDQDTDLTAENWHTVIDRYKQLIIEEHGSPFPQDANEQLWGAIAAVFSSWMNPRAIAYRSLHNIPGDWGTAVNIQAMVFGNMGDTSATGVAFTRNPSTGENLLFGEFLVNAQGEDVVAGIRTPQNLTEEARIAAASDKVSMEKLMPDVFTQFNKIANHLETHFRNMQDLEFTVERGKLWILQTRTGKQTARAALRIAVDMANEGLLTREEAICRIEPSSLDQLLHATIAPSAKRNVLVTGLPASPGAATGRIVFTSAEAEQLRNEHKPAILVRVETSPEDILGMHAAEGILTARGGMTSHAAVVARGMGKPCVSGAGGMRVDYQASELRILGKTFKTGDVVTIDGSSGQVLAGSVPMQQPVLSGAFGTLMSWADAIRRMQVRTNAETPHDAKTARSFGAQGIGLCRTEHMFFDSERIAIMREMILASNEEGRRIALDKLLPFQRADFVELFEIMSGQPVTIRLLDPPLHEFLPKLAEEVAEVAQAMGVDEELLRQRNESFFEFNPMLGHRGCRLAISHPEIVEMQARAVFEAAIIAGEKTGSLVVPEIMVPLVSLNRELEYVKDRIDAVAMAISEEAGVKFEYKIGTMIELPRAAVMADKIAGSAEFFSFGTNDLTQSTFGMSRDDAAAYLPDYERKNILESDPFVSLDLDGVGELMRIATRKGRAAKPDLKISICGEHGGDAASIFFCESLGLDYVSCSPFRVPIARLAAAQAAIKYKN
ncbi:MAG: pyruvate, phosphate dikinase [Hyphomicrobiales bacterium]|nr:pyruvate, phosphate dikinase [Hyphomicrobiales bacterium]